MRIDPMQPGAVQPASGADDVAKAAEVRRQAESVKPETTWEPLDKLLLRRMQASQLADAATNAVGHEQAARLVAETRDLAAADPAAARAAHADIQRDRLRHLLGGG